MNTVNFDVLNFDVLNEEKRLIGFNLRFFNDSSEEKTEQPTARKREKARDEGQVLKSTEIGTAGLFLASFTGIRVFGEYIYTGVMGLVNYNFLLLPEMGSNMDTAFMSAYIAYNFQQIILIALPLMLTVMAVGIITNLAQVGWHPTTKPLMPKFKRLSPMQGIKKIISFRTLVDLVKSLLKLAVIVIAIYMVLVNEVKMLGRFIYLDLLESMAYVVDVVINVGITVGALYTFVAGLDYFQQWLKHTKELKMTKQEVKEEYKQTEGNPQIKGKIRQKMREASMRRMMADVPSADVVITNPTHYAIALKYDKTKAEAPIVVAKGADYLARKIKEKAAESGVETIENKPLARTLYDTTDIGREIPPELYQAVAEVFAYLASVNKIAV